METTLLLDHDNSQLITSNVEIRQFLWERLRFRERNYFHSSAYKQRRWDGYRNFFDRQTGKFLTGLLPEILATLRFKNIEYKIEDTRDVFNFAVPNIDPHFLNQWNNKTPITLEDYQVDFVNQVIKHKRGIIFSPTSSGKSLAFIAIMKTLPPGTPTLVLQNRKSLALQNYNELTNWGFPNVGTLWSKSPKKPDIITCATVQSCSKIIDLLGEIKCLIVDEIHDMMSDEPVAVYKKLKKCGIRVALSATPFKFAETDKVQKFKVKGFFGPVLKTKATTSGIITTKELQERGRLSDSICRFYYIDEPQIPHDIYLDAVTHGIAESYHFHKIITRLAKSVKGRTLILVERLSHGDALSKMIPGSLWVQGKDDDAARSWVIENLQKSSSCVAIATQGIFNTGINVFVHNLINAAGGQAEHQIIQRMGRGLRVAKDKEILNYYDFIFRINDYLEKHSMKRVKILSSQGHKIQIIKKIDF